MLLELFLTGDGSHSVANRSIGDTYHSRFGAVNESRHIFVKNGLECLDPSLKEIRIFEAGFGTGLNALLTYEYAVKRGIRIFYQTVERDPLMPEITDRLNYPGFMESGDARDVFSGIHSSPWNRVIEIGESFSLLKIHTGLNEINLDDDLFHLVFFDAFAPHLQPELWTVTVFSKLFRSMKEGGILVTYSSKVTVQRNMREAGFLVHKVPGPAGKREIIRAVKNQRHPVSG